MQEKQRFLKMADDKASFEEAIKSRRAADFAALQVWHLLFFRACKNPVTMAQAACPHRVCIEALEEVSNTSALQHLLVLLLSLQAP